jgi:DNA-binding MarR family transcriptional regulator
LGNVSLLVNTEGTMMPELDADTKIMLPLWLPEATRLYLDHTLNGETVRKLARQTNAHPSTVSRKIRRIEARRDDPLVDEALSALAQTTVSKMETLNPIEEHSRMTATMRPALVSDEVEINREARRILRRLCEKDAVLVVANDMDRAVVLRTTPEGEQTRTAVVDRKVAHAFVLKDWICTERKGRISTYGITQMGKSALKRLIEEDRKRRHTSMGMAEARTPFLAQHQVWGTRDVPDDAGKNRKVRVNLAESPLSGLARRKGSDGKPFLSMDLVQAGEKLREDFERAHMGPRVAQNWDRFLTAGSNGGHSADSGVGSGSDAARDRVNGAVQDLGPGLADVVMRVCCFLEGLETAEKRLGWSARSGKIVLKIGLQRLMRYYEQKHGFQPGMID